MLSCIQPLLLFECKGLGEHESSTLYSSVSVMVFRALGTFGVAFFSVYRISFALQIWFICIVVVCNLLYQ